MSWEEVVDDIEEVAEDFEEVPENFDMTLDSPVVKKSNGLKLFLIFFIFVTISFIGAYYIFVTNLINLSNHDFLEGITLNVAREDAISFSYHDENYLLTLVSADEDEGTIEINVDSTKILFEDGGERALDLDNDGVHDMGIKFRGFSNGNANIYMKKFQMYSSLDLNNSSE